MSDREWSEPEVRIIPGPPPTPPRTVTNHPTTPTRGAEPRELDAHKVLRLERECEMWNEQVHDLARQLRETEVELERYREYVVEQGRRTKQLVKAMAQFITEVGLAGEAFKKAIRE